MIPPPTITTSSAASVVGSFSGITSMGYSGGAPPRRRLARLTRIAAVAPQM